MNLTAQQSAFVEELLVGTSHVALVARAGCGKTTTIIQGVVAYLRKFPRAEVIICAFNKPIQLEIEEKLNRLAINWRSCKAHTTHSLGFALVKERFGKFIQVDDKKVRKIIEAQNDPVYQMFFAQIARLVSLAKKEGFGFFDDCHIQDTHAWYRMADHYGVNDFEDTSSLDRCIEAAQRVYLISKEDTKVVDYDDMVLFPLVFNIRVRYQKDMIFVDEAQDTSRARRALVRKYLKPGGRMVVVGDDRQAIMGFAGASAEALEELVDELKAKTMPLNVTWRCPRSVVREAQRLVPDIQAADGAIEGEVIRIPALPEEMQPTDAILCRNNAPLVDNAYALIRKGIACKVEGREIGQDLINTVSRWKRAKRIPQFLDLLGDWASREIQKAIAKGKEEKVDQINDKAETLRVICRAVQEKGSQEMEDVKAFIENLFADDVRGVVTLCSYHKSKGREWPRVFLFEHTKRCPSPYAKQPWQLKQEHNLAYVAITRAQQTLAYLG